MLCARFKEGFKAIIWQGRPSVWGIVSRGSTALSSDLQICVCVSVCVSLFSSPVPLKSRRFCTSCWRVPVVGVKMAKKRGLWGYTNDVGTWVMSFTLGTPHLPIRAQRNICTWLLQILCLCCSCMTLCFYENSWAESRLKRFFKFDMKECSQSFLLL